MHYLKEVRILCKVDNQNEESLTPVLELLLGFQILTPILLYTSKEWKCFSQEKVLYKMNNFCKVLEEILIPTLIKKNPTQ